MNKKRWIALGIAVCLFIVSIVSSIRATVKTMDWREVFALDSTFTEEVIERGTSLDKIAILRLDGIIADGSVNGLSMTGYNHQEFLAMLDQAAEDPSIKGVIMRVNTPGGGVVESAEIAEKVKEIQSEYNKPVYISMGNTAASGGYYISAPAEKIFAHPATITGSIGVITESINFGEFAKKHGIETNTITSGKHKDIMSATRPMTDEERKIMQSIVDDMYNQFVQVIVDGREMEEKKVRELGDGRVYSGTQAKEHQLVDKLGSLDDAIALLKEDYQLTDASVVEYVSTGLGFRQLIGVKMQQMFKPEIDVLGLNDLIRQSNAPRPMYLYSK